MFLVFFPHQANGPRLVVGNFAHEVFYAPCEADLGEWKTFFLYCMRIWLMILYAYAIMQKRKDCSKSKCEKQAGELI